MGVKAVFKGLFGSSAMASAVAESNMNSVSVDELGAFSGVYGGKTFDGDKFAGGFGDTNFLVWDYWKLRTRSVEMFATNLYARGIIRRLVTNEIGAGLSLEAIPNAAILGKTEESLQEWADDVENRFQIWSENPIICDFKQQNTFGKIQQIARQTALIAGDVLVVNRFNKITNLPQIQLIDGSAVQSPLDVPRKGHTIQHGVETDRNGRQVAYWVLQKDGTIKRIPAFGEKSGRRLAWLYYGTDKLVDNVRGQPFLSLALQSIKEMDRFRDAEQRAAVINASLAMFVRKTEDKPSTLPLSNGAIRKDTIEKIDPDGTPRNFGITKQIAGMVIEELQVGEEPVSFDTRRPNVNFGIFEQQIIAVLAWGNEIPPEILTLSFNSNYSASKAALNEFKIYLDKTRKDFASQFLKPIYQSWLIQETLTGRISAAGLLEAWRNPLKYQEYGAWIEADFQGQIKPSLDLGKDVKTYGAAVDRGWMTNSRASKELFGTKFSSNVKRIKREKAESKVLIDEIPDSKVSASMDNEEIIAGVQEVVLEALDQLDTGQK